MPLLFVFFLVSGFCSLVYENIWLRLGMAEYGVTSAMVSIVLSVFMAGLALGSFGAGRILRARSSGAGAAGRALRGYAIAELCIGISGIVVPFEMHLGRFLLEKTGVSGSFAYYFGSALWLALVLLPWCTAMGATFPLAMAALEKSGNQGARRSFSFLYLANVLGAMVGCLLPAFILVERLGFAKTLHVAATLNLLLAIAAFIASTRLRTAEPAASSATVSAASDVKPPAKDAGSRSLIALLFTSGLVGMGLEVVWVRQFAPYLGTVVYAFALLLAVYLAATFAGSSIYRWRSNLLPATAWSVVALLALASLIASDPRFASSLPDALFQGGLVRVLVGVAPVAAAMGFLTPMLVDRWSGGDPERAGAAYAVNVLGCILGPLVAGFILLPLVGERASTVLLALPLFAFGLILSRRWAEHGTIAMAGVLVVALTGTYLTQFPGALVKRDHTATIVAGGSGMQKRLLVNGYGITSLTPITKMMAHFPLAVFGQPKNGLVICFGMGTTFRSMHSWGIPTTVVELVPSVPDVFGYFHADAAQVLASPTAHVVIDDGRRFLERTPELYDVIAIDPPPPVEAAVSSLLYSKEFYALARKKLSPGGILQQWVPNTEPDVVSAILRSLNESFPYVRMFGSVENWGYHFLASERPIEIPTAQVLASRMPKSAVTDMLEWGPRHTAEEQLGLVLSHEAAVASKLGSTPALTDDRAYNEYYWARRAGW